MIWGYAGPWYGEFLMKDGDYVSDKTEQLWVKLDFLKSNGLQCMGMSLKAVTELDEAVLERLGEELRDKDLHISGGVGYDYLNADADEIKRQSDFYADTIERLGDLLRLSICTTGPHAGHRFDRSMPLDEKFDRLSKCLTPIVDICKEKGLTFGIENHADYYVSDMVAVCERTPGLGIFLDTGNCFMVGEKPVPAYREAAPLLVGTHFKDHHVRPVPSGRPMHFEVKGAALGEGDAELAACWDIIKELHPDPDTLVMEMEMICPTDDMTPPDCLEKSLAFIRGLEKE